MSVHPSLSYAICISFPDDNLHKYQWIFTKLFFVVVFFFCRGGGGGGGGGLRLFQEYFAYIKPIVHQRWAKTGEPVEKPPDHP